jgi:NAD(P)-dependent dehydrogenase (short-subunit alcohol dehydrogenase family)
MDLGLTDALVLVTGSTEGIGYEIALQFARNGARVVVNGRNQDKLEQTIAKIGDVQDVTHKPVGVAADLGTAEGCAHLVKEVKSMGDLTVLVNNVGIFQIKDFEEATDEVWQARDLSSIY